MQSLIGPEVLDDLALTAFTSPRGAIIEVGVFQGGSALRLYQVAREQGRRLMLFDTFEGIPFKDAMDTHSVGDFKESSYHAIKSAFPEADVIKGVFPDSATRIPIPPVGFAHLDVDQYKSYKDAIQFLLPRMMEQGVMWFDDYGCLGGATQAVDEIFRAQDLRRAPCGKTYVVCTADLIPKG